MTTTIRQTLEALANIPHPAGAVEVSEWDNPADPTSGRYFQGTQWFIDRSDDEYEKSLIVEIWGAQSHQGVVDRHLDLDEERREQMTFHIPAHVRALGEALIAAADEWEQMASRDPVGGAYRN